MIKSINIIDSETTGTAATDNVIELAQAVLNITLLEFKNLSLLDIEDIDIRCTRYKPDARIHVHAHAVHGITTLDLLHCKHHSKVEVEKADLYIFHNASFDTRLIKQSNKNITFDEVLCSMDFARMWIKQNKKGVTAKLDDLLLYFLPDVNKDLIIRKHGAKIDVLKTIIVLQGLVNKFEGLKTWDDLYNFYLTLRNMR